MSNDNQKGNCFLASYPKSGSTWMRLALTSVADKASIIDINHSGKMLGSIAADRGLFARMLDIDASDLGHEEISILRPYFFDLCSREPGAISIWKVHDAWTLTPDNEPLFPPASTAASVYLVRDPRDVAPSLANHCDCSIDAAIEILANEQFQFSQRKDRLQGQLPQMVSSWSRHVESWIDQARPSPLVIRYEDMVADFANQLAKVAKAFNLPHNSEVIAVAVAATRFETLKAQEEREGFRQRISRNNPFFRRGVVGGWRDSLTSAQVTRIEQDHWPMMQRLGYL